MTRLDIMDNGRLKIENYKVVVYCEAYLDEEYTASDILDIVAEIRKNFTPPANARIQLASATGGLIPKNT